MIKAYEDDWVTGEGLEDAKPYIKFFRVFRLLRVVCFVAIFFMAVFYFVYRRY